MHDLQDQRVGIGPALALLDAVRNDSTAQVYGMAAVIDPQTLASSTVELIYRMLGMAEILDEIDDLCELAWMSETRWAFHEVAICRIDRAFPWTPAQILGRNFARNLFEHLYTEANLERRSGLLRFRLVMHYTTPYFVRQWTLGFGYALTLIATELADLEDVDLDRRVDGYRA